MTVLARLLVDSTYSQLAAFLGDPNFPTVAIRSSESQQETSRGQRILYFQDLYKTYSRLQFSHWEDRAVAMKGLEQRLSRGFKCQGTFGILDDSAVASHASLLHRSLLWHRAVEEDSLQKIVFPPDRQKVPTWSWMAFQGHIDYLSVPFNGVEWASDDLKSSWNSKETRSVGRAQTWDITAIARRLSPELSSEEGIDLFFNFRGQSHPQPSSSLCVVIGRAKGDAAIERRTHYILLAKPVGLIGVQEYDICERVGAGRVPGRCIDFSKPGLKIMIR